MSVAAALKAAPGRAGDTLSNFGQSAINFFDSMQRPTQGTIRVAGELVQVDEKGFNPAAYYDRVSFSKEYFPGITGELLKQHAALFKRVFNNEDYPMNPKNPLPPCDKAEMGDITLGLKNRFKKLAEEIDVLEGTEHDTGVLRTKIKQLSRLKEFIYMLEKNAADDLCNPYGGAPTPGFGKDDAEENDKLRNTLRRFIIFLLQNKKRLDEYQNEYGSLADIVMPVIGDDKEITSETLSKYVNDWRKKHRSELPSLLIQILGITGEKSDLFEKKMQQELRELADKIRKDVMMRTATGGGEVQEGGVDISDVRKRISEIMKENTDPAQMITALVSYIVTALEKNETETTSLETQKITDVNKIKELAEKLKNSENSLAFTQETMVKLQEAKAAAEKSAIELSASDSEKKNRLQLLETTYKSATTAAEAVNKQLLEEKQTIQIELDAARATLLENSTKISEKAVELAALQGEYTTLKERFDGVFNTNAELQKQSSEASTMLAQLVADKVALVDEELRMRRQLNDLLKETGKAELKPEDYPAALGFAKELSIVQAGGGEKELLAQINGLQADLAAAKAAQDETIKTKGEENAALKIQIVGLEEQVANSLKECAARKCGSIIEVEKKMKEKDTKILELIKSLADKEAVAAKLQSELAKCTDLSTVEKQKYEATIQSQLQQLSTMKEADSATILKLQAESKEMLEKEKAATKAARADVKNKWNEIVRLKSQIEGLGKNKLVGLAKRAAAASARPGLGPGSTPGSPKLPGSTPGTPKLPGSRPGTPTLPGSRPGTPTLPGSRPGSRPGTPKAAKFSSTKLKAVAAFKAAGERGAKKKAEEVARANGSRPNSRPGTPKANGSRPGTPKAPKLNTTKLKAVAAFKAAGERGAKKKAEEAARAKKAAEKEAAEHEEASRLAKERAEREQTAEAMAAAEKAAAAAAEKAAVATAAAEADVKAAAAAAAATEVAEREAAAAAESARVNTEKAAAAAAAAAAATAAAAQAEEAAAAARRRTDDALKAEQAAAAEAAKAAETRRLADEKAKRDKSEGAVAAAGAAFKAMGEATRKKKAATEEAAKRKAEEAAAAAKEAAAEEASKLKARQAEAAEKAAAKEAAAAAAAESERRKAEEEAAAEAAAEAERAAAEAKRLTEEAAAKKRAADEEAAIHERDSRLAQEKAEREQTAAAAMAAAAAAKRAATAAAAQKAAEEEEARKREEEHAAAEEAAVTERAARVKAEESAAAEAAAAAAAAEAAERARARAEEVAAAENAVRRTAAENAARSAAVPLEGEPESTSQRTCTSIAAELKALAKKTMLAKLNNKLPEATNIRQQKQLGEESLRLGCSNEQSQNPTKPPVTPATPAKPKIKTYEQIGASFEKTLRAILMQIRKGTGAIMAAAITEDISQYGSLNKELKNSPIGKLIDSYKLQSEFFRSAPVHDPTTSASSEPWNSYFTKIWNAVWTQSITKKNVKRAPYPKTKAFLKQLIMDIFKAYIQQYNIEIDGVVNPDASLLEKASVVLPQFKEYVGDIMIDLEKNKKQTLYSLLGIKDQMLSDYLSK
jgi:hypothetical protein